MRMMSFSMTQAAIADRSKTVTRRLAWLGLKPGTLLRAVNKSMGLRRGESPVELALIRVTDVRREQLEAITDDDVAREGYPKMSSEEFVARFCEAMGCDPADVVTRIEFEYVDAATCSVCGRLAPLRDDECPDCCH